MDTQVPLLSSSSDASCLVRGRNSRPSPIDPALTERPAASTATRWERWLSQRVYRRLNRLHAGLLHVEDHDGSHDFGAPVDDLPASRVRVCNARFYHDLAWKGSMAVDEGYLRGDWVTDDLVSLFRLFLRNASAMQDLEGATGWWSAPWKWLCRYLTRNTLSGSRRNIEAHYDLGNDFFRTFLDETMSYSCGIFHTPDATLRDASLAKFERICSRLRLRPEHHLIEIGTGWGGFAIYAAQRYGCRVTTTTISRQQEQYVRQAIQEMGLGSRVTVLNQDYRLLRGHFDRLVSVEMIEAVGHEYLPTYFEVCSRLLKPDGEMLLQAIMIPDQRYEAYRRSVDFIQRYIFPGGCLPSLSAMVHAAKYTPDLQLAQLEDLAVHYAETLRRWRSRFRSRLADIREMGLDDRFIRTWDYYLAYCEAGFLERWINVAQLHWVKPEVRFPLSF